MTSVAYHLGPRRAKAGAPLPAVRRSGPTAHATGGSGGNTINATFAQHRDV